MVPYSAQVHVIEIVTEDVEKRLGTCPPAAPFLKAVDLNIGFC
ncbi:hypothetical protein [Pyrobaculum aerophilum]|nr:hypothetical protein [Pyrobaculum sp.]